MQRHPDGARGTGGTVLADGTRLADLFDHDQRVLAARIWMEPELFELEMEKVFARAWMPVAHVSEFENPGDFVTRYIGQDQVIVSQDTSGDLKVMLNVCPHRGAPVCQAESGTARTHRCPFHGWIYGTDGKLMGVPFEKLVYGDRLERADRGLRQARVGVMAGIVFATWDASAPSLEEYIGDYRPYLEMMLCRTDGGLEVTGAPQRYTIDANWKIVAEGFFGDVYHVPAVHRSLADIGVMNIMDGTFYGYKVSINGHGLQCPDHEHHGVSGDATEVLTNVTPVGMTPDMVPQLERHLSAAQIDMLARTPPSIAGLFPSTAVVMVGSGVSNTQIASLRFYVPLSPTQTEIMSFTLVERDTPQEYKDALHKTTIGTFGVAGIFETDDAEVWSEVQRAVRGVMGRKTLASYQAYQTPSEPTLPGSGQGQTFRGVSGDDNAWGFYERYIDFMEDRPW